MLAEFGFGILVFTFALALYSACAAVYGYFKKSLRWVESSRRAMQLTFPLITLAAGTLIYLLCNGHYELQYVYSVTSNDMPLYLKITALWGGQAGSLLFWSWLLSAFTSAVTFRKWERDREFLPWVMVVTSITVAFFLAMNIFFKDENPFARLWQTMDGNVIVSMFQPAGTFAVSIQNGQGLNPLLRHPGMVIHPPMLYLGFVSFVIPYAFAMAALITGRTDDRWIRITRRWTLWAWLFLSCGLVLGMRWAYDVLGWGGYWGWDPVEIAALLPWLVGTPFLHTVVIQEKRGMFKQLNMVLITLTYVLIIFGTFLTRSGVLSSVHAFAQSAIGPMFFGFIAISLFISIALLIHRWNDLRDETSLGKVSMLSREALFLLMALLFGAFFIVCFWGILFPLISEIVTGQKITVGPPFYRPAVAPIMGALIVLMGIAPLSSWTYGTIKTIGRAAWKTAIPAAVVPVILFAAGMKNIVALIGFTLIAFTVFVTLYELWRGVRGRQKLQKAQVMNGQPASVISSRQQLDYKTALWIVFLIGGVNIILGLVNIVLKSDYGWEKYTGSYQLIFGVVFVVLGFFVSRKSTTALVLALMIYAVGGLVALFQFIMQGNILAISVILTRIILIIFLIRGISVVKVLNSSDFSASLIDLISRNRRRYGGYIIHISMVLMAIGILGIEVFQTTTQKTLATGESLELSGYTMRFDSLAQFPTADSRWVTRAEVSILKNGQLVDVLHPRYDLYPDGQPMTIPGVRSTLADDFYVVLVNWEAISPQAAPFKVYHNPLVMWLWIGSIIFIVGTLVAAWPSKEEPAAR
jgi:cytochrome c-type biogenesis protein CcmF